MKKIRQIIKEHLPIIIASIPVIVIGVYIIRFALEIAFGISRFGGGGIIGFVKGAFAVFAAINLAWGAILALSKAGEAIGEFWIAVYVVAMIVGVLFLCVRLGVQEPDDDGYSAYDAGYDQGWSDCKEVYGIE